MAACGNHWCIWLYSARIQTNTAKLTDQHFTVQMVSHPKHAAKATQEFLKVKKWNILK